MADRVPNATSRAIPAGGVPDKMRRQPIEEQASGAIELPKLAAAQKDPTLRPIVQTRIHMALLAMAVGLSIAAPFLFAFAIRAIDRPVPDVAAAIGPYATIPALFGVYAVAQAILRRGRGLLELFVGAGVGLPLGLWFALDVQSAYNDFFDADGVVVWLAISYGVVAVIAVGIAVIVGNAWGPRGAWTGAFGVLSAWTALWATAAIYHLATLDRQAKTAREAHAPEVGVLLMIGVLALAALARRRGNDSA